MNDFQKNNEDPKSSQRMVLAFALIFLVIIVSQWLMSKYGPKPAQPAPSQTQSQTQNPAAPAPATGPAPAAVAPPAVAQASTNTKIAAAKAAPEQAAAEAETVVENELYKVTFSNRGGAVKGWILKQQQDEKGRPLELVNSAGAERYGLPLSLYTYDADLTKKLNSALYVAKSTSAGALVTELPAGAKPDRTGRTQAELIKQAAQSGAQHTQSLSFTYSDGETQVKKTFRFDETYVVHADVEVTQKGNPATTLFAWPAGFGDQRDSIAYAHANIAFDNGSSITRQGVSKSFFGRGKMATNGDSVKGPLAWAGPEDQYFAAVFLPDHPQAAQMVTFNNPIPQDAAKNDNKTFALLGAAVGNATGPTSLRIFVGPKLLHVLSSVHAAAPGAAAGAEVSYTGPTLDNMIDFGFFSFIAKPLFLWLRWTYEHMVPNWGWAILVVTIIINLALLPVRLKQIKSSMKMMKAQPLVDAINRKFQGVKFSDQSKMQAKNAEIQALYKQEGINPMGGCLPMLIQIPILWAFFKVLEIAVELRHAPWIWVHDLSAPDPLHILPIALFVSMVFLQRMTPTPGVDAMQAKMMQITMPLMFGWFAWNFAAGLSVYYTAGNLIAITQQAVLNRTSLGKEMRATMARRAKAAAAKKKR